uniref:Uncharacterized protein n=1 Tax=Anguilla anguilla TaxID=7936 RepID=A0A0E9PUB4_ANGAN
MGGTVMHILLPEIAHI